MKPVLNKHVLLRHMRRAGTIGAVASVVAVGMGCASYTSQFREATATTPVDGISYFMPRRDIVVTLVVEGGERKISVEPGGVYADQSAEYVLRYHRNMVGKNDLKLTVTNQGLLQTSAAVTTSSLTDALKNLASAVAWTGPLPMMAPAPPALPCAADGTYTYNIPIVTPLPANACPAFCGLTCNITRLSSPGGGYSKAQAKNKGSSPGIYYRQAIPYLVTVSDGAQTVPVLTSSPTDAPVRFAPISRALFTNSNSTVTLQDGMLTGYNQEADGELVALFKLPADVIGAYFAAVGNMLTSRNTALQNEKTYLETIRLLEQQRKTTDDCLKALADKDDDQIAKLCK